MAVIPQEVQEAFNSVQAVVFATASTDAQPNASIVGMKKILDDETIYLSDQFFKKTLANIQANDKCSIVFWGDKGAYQIYGTMTYVTEGAQFEEQCVWVNGAFEAMGMPIKAKGGVFVKVESVYSSAAGPMAGAQLA